MRSLTALLAVLGLAACSSTTAQPSSSTAGGGDGSSSVGSSGHGSGLTGISAVSASGASSGASIAATVGSASGSSGAAGASTNSVAATLSSASVSSAAGTSGTSVTGSSSSGTGQCVPNGVAPGASGAAMCCSGMVNSGGFCTAATSSSSGTGTAGSGGSSGGTTICSTQNCTVYAQTGTDLYSIDPSTLAQTHVGAFSGDLSGASVYDIAVRADGLIYAITATDLYSVNPSTCVGTHIAVLTGANGFNGLTFTLTGTLLAADNSTGDVDAIDPTTGTVSTVGNYGSLSGTQLYSSGDLVALSNGVIYATATDNSGNNPDVLVTVDPTNSYAATVVGSTGYYGIYGLAYWAGVVYGFDDEGDSLSIDPTTGIATLISNNSAFMWFGAGTTPNAPVIDH